MPIAPSSAKTPIIEYSIFGAAALLFVTPWAGGFIAEGTPSLSLWTVAALTAACGAYALAAANRNAAWALLVLAGWLFIAPWALGFTASVTAFWAHIASSFGLTALAAATIWRRSETDGAVAA